LKGRFELAIVDYPWGNGLQGRSESTLTIPLFEQAVDMESIEQNIRSKLLTVRANAVQRGVFVGMVVIARDD
jgi:hypothetical protein